jgi:hypothetical protein
MSNLLKIAGRPAAKKVPQPRKRQCYSQEAVNQALSAIRNDGMPIKEASRRFGIPRSTLQDKVHGRTQDDCMPGPDPVLTRAEEEALTQYIIQMSKIGYPLSRDQLADIVKDLLYKDGRKNPFKNNKPGREWLQAFLRRNPNNSERVPENLGKERAVVTKEKIEHWFADM